MGGSQEAKTPNDNPFPHSLLHCAMVPGTVAASGACINNILGNPVMTELYLEAACQEVLADLGPRDPASSHRRGQGWYSHFILAKVLGNTVPPMWRLALRVCSTSIPNRYETLLHIRVVILLRVSTENSRAHRF
jgi:hypothetical protein